MLRIRFFSVEKGAVMKRMLVTGATGFIGRHVLQPLVERGFEVHGMGIREEAVPDVKSHTGDLMDCASTGALMQKISPTHLLHLAWDAEPGKYWTSPKNMDWVTASLRMYRAFVGAGGQRIVGAGTCAEYDWSHSLLDEMNTPCTPTTLYGSAKHGLHIILAAAARLDNVSLAWGRVFFLYGPGEKRGRLVSDIIAGLLSGQPVQTTAGTQIRDFLHVADVAGAFAALCDTAIEGPINIASGKPQSLAEVIGMVSEMTDKPHLLQLGARLTPPSDPSRLVAAVERLHGEVGFVPTFDLESGLRDTVSWWRGQLLVEGKGTDMREIKS